MSAFGKKRQRLKNMITMFTRDSATLHSFVYWLSMITKFNLILIASLTLGGCADARSDHDKLEELLGVEICTEALVTETTKPENVSSFRFDEIYEFEVRASQQCVASIIDRVDESNTCFEYPDQLSCEYEGGDTVIINEDNNILLISHAT